MSKSECHSELDWSAFCYAAGELASAEAAAFEQRLAEEQPAREALARAVELTQAVAAAETLEPVVVVQTGRSLWGRSQWGRRLAWMAVGSAASLLITAVIGTAWKQTGSTVPAGTGDLAAAWSQTRQELSSASDGGLGENGLWYPDHFEAMSSRAESQGNSQDDSPDDEALVATPAWLTAAVLGSAGLPMGEDPADADAVDADKTPFDGQRTEN
jgi:hypothetical protein